MPPIIIVLIIALLAAGGIGGYTYLKEKQSQPIDNEIQEQVRDEKTLDENIPTIHVQEETSKYISGSVEFNKALVVDITGQEGNQTLTVVLPDLFIIEVQTNENTQYPCANPNSCGKINRYCTVAIKATVKKYKQPSEDIPIYGIIQAQEIELLNCDPFLKNYKTS